MMLNGAQKTSFQDHLRDVLTKLNQRSDPLVRDHDSKLVCDYCGSGGHTVVSCMYVKECSSDEDRLLSQIIKI